MIHITDTTTYEASTDLIKSDHEAKNDDNYDFDLPLTRANNNYPVKMTVIGFDSEQALSGYVKMSFGESSAIKYGIPQGIYLVCHMAIYKKLAQSNYESIKPRNHTTNTDDTPMGWLVSEYNLNKKLVKGFEVTSVPINGFVTASTVLRYIKCDLSGKTYGKYIPYNISNLTWQYVLSYSPGWE